MNALDYLLKANLYGLLFVGCYWLLLRRHTFFGLNRVYLLASVVLSLSLPVVTLPAETVETLPVPVGVMALPVTVSASQAADQPLDAAPDREQLMLWAYAIVSLVLLIRLGVRVGRLLWLIRQSDRQIEDGYVLVHPSDPTLPTFSFFRYIMLNPADRHNGLILRHERVHVRQWHSADVLGLGIVQALFWACPVLLLIDRMLRQVHEFLADKPAAQPTEYARFLVDYSLGTQLGLSHSDTLTNSFFTPSLLKQRILMLHQKATTRWALGKYVLILPLAFGLLAMTTAREEIVTAVGQLQDNTITVTGQVMSGKDGKPLPGANIVNTETSKGTTTDVEGRFTLKNVSKAAKISVSFVGFETTIMQLGGRTTVAVSLAPTDPNVLPAMGATAPYKAIKPNPSMPVRTPPSVETINGKVYRAVEEPAVFPTGIPGLMQYVAHTLRYPAKAKAAGIEGNVLVQFVVLPTGAIGSARIKRGIGSGCDEEALRVVKQMPRWIPGQQNGKAVATQYVLPIQFALEKKTDDKRTGQVSGNQLNNVHVVAYEPTSTPTPQKQVSLTGDEVFTVVEQVPEFPGGIRALYQYLARNLRYPTEARQNKVQGRVYVKFIVDKTGDIRELRLLKGIGGGCDEEAIRVVSQMPNWIPGKQQGKVVSVMYNLPIQFSLEKRTDDKRTGQVMPDAKPDWEQPAGNILANNKHKEVALYDEMSTVHRTQYRRYAMPLPDSLKPSGLTVRVREIGGLGEGDPLYIIDGVEASKDELSKLVNPNNIGSVDVLKGPSAVVIYGEKARSGVIRVTTKKK